MSDSTPIPDDVAADETETPKKRSPVERVIVWTLIAGLLVVLGIEATSQNGYTATLAAFQERFSNQEGVSRLNDVRPEISGWPSESESDGLMVGNTAANKIIALRWFSFFKNYEIQLRVEAGEENPVIMNLTTADAEEPAAVVVDDGGDGDMVDYSGDSAPGAAMSGGPGGGFGGPAGGFSGGHSAAGPGAGGPGGGGPGRGGQRGGRSRPSPGLLGELEQDWVQAELGMTEEQLAKLPDITASLRPDFSALISLPEDERRAAFLEMNSGRAAKGETAAKELLDEEQFGRAREFLFQRMGAEAFAREDVATELGLDDSQKKQVAELMEQLQTSVASLGRASSDEREKAKAPWKSLMLEMLSEEQAGKWKAMLGAPPENGPEPEPQARPQRPSSGESE